MSNIRQNKGITLVALVITIVILLILAGVTISALTGNGLLEKAQLAKDETLKQEATEKINFKITEVEMASWVEKQRMPTLQEFADELCKNENDEFEYVLTKSKKTGDRLENIVVADSIYTKYKEYPYEFEINSSLQLASIDGIKVADVENPSGGNNNIPSSTPSSNVILALSCTAVQEGANINVTINPTFAEGKSNSDVYEYILVVDGKTYLTTKDLECSITPIEPLKIYKISVIGIDTDTGEIRSEIFELKTAGLTYTKQLLDYTVITSSNVCNIKYACNENDKYSYYDLDISKGKTTASDSFPLNFYDTDLTTNAHNRYEASTSLTSYKYKSRVDSSAWGKDITIKASHSSQGTYYLRFNFLNEENGVISYMSFSKEDTTKSMKIPNNTKYIAVSCSGGNVYIYEISI